MIQTMEGGTAKLEPSTLANAGWRMCGWPADHPYTRLQRLRSAQRQVAEDALSQLSELWLRNEGATVVRSEEAEEPSSFLSRLKDELKGRVSYLPEEAEQRPQLWEAAKRGWWNPSTEQSGWMAPLPALMPELLREAAQVRSAGIPQDGIDQLSASEAGELGSLMPKLIWAFEHADREARAISIREGIHPAIHSEASRAWESREKRLCIVGGKLSGATKPGIPAHDGVRVAWSSQRIAHIIDLKQRRQNHNGWPNNGLRKHERVRIALSCFRSVLEALCISAEELAERMEAGEGRGQIPDQLAPFAPWDWLILHQPMHRRSALLEVRKLLPRTVAEIRSWGQLLSGAKRSEHEFSESDPDDPHPLVALQLLNSAVKRLELEASRERAPHARRKMDQRCLQLYRAKQDLLVRLAAEGILLRGPNDPESIGYEGTLVGRSDMELHAFHSEPQFIWGLDVTQEAKEMLRQIAQQTDRTERLALLREHFSLRGALAQALGHTELRLPKDVR